MRYVRTNPSVARDNGLLPVQTKIVARLTKEIKYLSPGEIKQITIPWSDFIFSNAEPWPKQFRTGLERYCQFYRERPAVEADPNRRYKYVPMFSQERARRAFSRSAGTYITTGDWLLRSVSGHQYTLTELLSKVPEQSGRDLAQRFVKDPSKFLGAIREGAKKTIIQNIVDYPALVWSVDQNTFVPFLDVPEVQEKRPRIANCDGVQLNLIGFCAPGRGRTCLTDDPNVHGFIVWTLRGLFLTASMKSIANLTHELMHIAQVIANQLLFANRKPELAFIDRFYAPAVYGFQKKSLREYTDPSYLELPIEFYPNALSASMQGRLPFAPDVSPIYKIAEQKLQQMLQTRNAKLRKSFLEAAAKYSNVELNEHNKQLIRDIANFKPEEIGYTAYLGCMQGPTKVDGKFFVGYLLDFLFREPAISYEETLAFLERHVALFQAPPAIQTFIPYLAAVFVTTREAAFQVIEFIETSIRSSPDAPTDPDELAGFIEDMAVYAAYTISIDIPELKAVPLHLYQPEVMERWVQRHYNVRHKWEDNENTHIVWDKVLRQLPRSLRQTADKKYVDVLMPVVQATLDRYGVKALYEQIQQYDEWKNEND